MTTASAMPHRRIDDKAVLAMFRGETAGKRLEPGEVLFANGDPSTDMYVVLEGTLTIRNGPVVYEDVGPGGIVGEMGIVEQLTPRSASVLALVPSTVVAIDETHFLALVEKAPEFALTVMRVLSRRLRVMDRRYRG